MIRSIAGSCIKEPPSDIQLVEGQSIELEYTLWNPGLTSTFLKNGVFLPTLKNIETVVDGVCRKLKITNITQKDVGLYCLEVLGHRSGPTDLIIKRMKLILHYITVCYITPTQQTQTHINTHDNEVNISSFNNITKTTMFVCCICV